MTDEEGIAILRARSGTMYDPRVVEAFVALVPTLRQEDDALDREAPPVEAMELLTNTSVGDGRSVSDEDVVSLAEVRKVAPAAFERIRRRLPDAETCLLFKGAGSDTLAVAEATPRIRPAFAGARLQLGEGLSGWVAAHRSRAVNSSPDLELGDAASALGLQSCASVPLFAVGDLVGVLSVYLPQPRGFSDADVRAIGMIAHEVGLELARRSQDTDDAREFVA
jgi:hypothetical protein